MYVPFSQYRSFLFFFNSRLIADEMEHISLTCKDADYLDFMSSAISSPSRPELSAIFADCYDPVVSAGWQSILRI